MTKRDEGFTIVELLIVIVVIAILAAISIVAYNGIQQRARDSRRAQDMSTLTKALTLYNLDKGGLPTTFSYGGNDAGGWDISSRAPWVSFLTNEYGGSAPVDPINASTTDPSSRGTAYFYYCYSNPSGFDSSGSPHAVYGYWSELGARKSLVMVVDRCLTSV